MASGNSSRRPRMPLEKEAEISRLLSQCVPHAQIVSYLRQKWGINQSTVYAYIQEVYSRWAELPSLDPAGRKEQMRQALMDFYTKAMKGGAYSAAVTALDRLCKLDGLYAPDVVVAKGELASQGQSVQENDPDKVRQRIAELAGKYGYAKQAATVSGPAGEATGAGGEGLGGPKVDPPILN